MTALHWTLNGESLSASHGGVDVRVSSEKHTLRAGWNLLMFRGYCWGYPPFRAGLILAGPAESLWQVQLSGTPPP